MLEQPINNFRLGLGLLIRQLGLVMEVGNSGAQKRLSR